MSNSKYSEAIAPIKAAIIKTVEAELEMLLTAKDREIKKLKLKLKKRQDHNFDQEQRSLFLDRGFKIAIQARELENVRSELEMEKKTSKEQRDLLAKATEKINVAADRLAKLEKQLESRKRKWREFKEDMEGDGASDSV